MPNYPYNTCSIYILTTQATFASELVHSNSAFYEQNSSHACEKRKAEERHLGV
jgi:hypothetical protein